MQQSRLESILEISMNYLSGFIVAYFVYAWVVMPNTWLRNNPFLVTLLFTVVSIIRSYVWRRFFNAGLHNLAHQAASKILVKGGLQ